VTFESSADADTARRAMNGRLVDGRCLEVTCLPSYTGDISASKGR